MRVYDDTTNGYICKYAAQFISTECVEKGFGVCQAMGFLRKGSLIGGVIFHNYDPESGTIELSAGIDPAYLLTRGEIQDMMDAPFVRMNCQLIYFSLDKANKKLRSTFRRLGCKEYIIPRMLGPTKSLALNTLTAEDWFSSRYSKRK